MSPPNRGVRRHARTLVQRLRSRHDVLFLCHNLAEFWAAAELCPDVPRALPRSADEYLSLVRSAIVGLCCRIHAAVPLASLGVPSIGVGTDSRLLTLETIGIKTFYVKDATAERLEADDAQAAAARAAELDRRREALHAVLQDRARDVRGQLDRLQSQADRPRPRSCWAGMRSPPAQ